MLKNLIIKILEFLGLLSSDNALSEKEDTIYELKPIMSDYERKFYNIT